MARRLLGAALVLATLLPAGAFAQSNRNCGDRQTIIERLSDRYGESRSGGGLTHTNGVLEVFTSPDTGTWTVVLTLPTGQTCLVAAGEFWEQAPLELTKSGAPV